MLDNYIISSEKTLLQIDSICDLLSKCYWTQNRTRETIQKSIDNSLCFGVYVNNIQVGFARVVTDYATVYWIGDVVIDEEYRGKGLGKALINKITETEELKNLTGILRTKDAHGLYQQYGFKKDTETFMFRKL